MQHWDRPHFTAALITGLALAGLTVSDAALAQDVDRGGTSGIAKDIVRTPGVAQAPYPENWQGEITGIAALEKCIPDDVQQLYLNAFQGYLDPYVYTKAEISVMSVANYEDLLRERWRAVGYNVDDPNRNFRPVALNSRFKTFGCGEWSEGKDHEILVVEVIKSGSEQQGDGTDDELSPEAQALLDNISDGSGTSSDSQLDGVYSGIGDEPPGNYREELSPEAQAALDNIADGSGTPPDNQLDGVYSGIGDEPPGNSRDELSPEAQALLDNIGDGSGDAIQATADGSAEGGLSQDAQAVLDPVSEGPGNGTPNPTGPPGQIASADPVGESRGVGTPGANPPAAVPAATPPAVDPRLVGTWTLISAPGIAWNWEIRGDGSYALRDGARIVHEGTVTFIGGNWTLQSPTWQDAGRYSVDERQAIIVGTLGPGTWARETR